MVCVCMPNVNALNNMHDIAGLEIQQSRVSEAAPSHAINQR